MSKGRPTNLRTVLSVAAVVVALLSASAAVSLVFATTRLEQMRSDIAAAVESVRTIEEAEVSLLLHVRAGDAAERQVYERDLLRFLDDAASYVRTPEAARALGDIRVEVDQYLEVSRQPDAPELIDRETRAIAALERLVDIKVANARAADRRASRWSQLANIAGIALGIAIVVTTAALVLWLRRRVLRPLFGLAATMKQFGDGNRGVRAEESGPLELREMTSRFNEMADAIGAQRQAQTAFLGGVAHDLRNPLAALKLAADMVGPNEPLPPEPVLRRTFGIMSRQIAQLDRMVGDFLDMAKIESGELQLELAQHDLCAIVRSSLDLFDGTRERLAVTIPDQPIEIACDVVRIGQAVTNLVSNAVKYSPKDAPIAVVVAAAGDAVTIAVSDRGVGIARDDHDRIFEPFQRGLASNSDVPGTGLGLYNVQRIVRAHGGRIEVESVPGHGSTFRIHLPRSAARPLNEAGTARSVA